jgi:hypothetical protein
MVKEQDFRFGQEKKSFWKFNIILGRLSSSVGARCLSLSRLALIVDTKSKEREGVFSHPWNASICSSGLLGWPSKLSM